MSSPSPDDERNKERKRKSTGSLDDTDAPSGSPFSLSFFKLGLPTSGYVMLVTEIIPSFIHQALSHFHIGANEHNSWIWYNNQFYAVLFAIPSSFMIATLSDGYKYGKFIACIVMLTLMCLTGLCSLLGTLPDLAPSTMWIVNHLSPYSSFVFYVTLPLRVTIFTDVFAKHRSHERARKAFAAYWVCNIAGVTVLVAAYQHYFEKENARVQFGLLMSLLVSNLLYFLITCVILMTLPLELPLKNLFLYHIRCIWFALRHQPPKYLRSEKYNWLDPALEKYTQTEVKRSRSLAQMILLVIPMAGYAAGHAFIYYNYYNYAYEIKWFGPMAHSYNCFYVHTLFTILFIIVVEVVVLPTLYHCFGHFNGIWLLVAGYFLMGIPLSSLVYHEATCAEQNTTRYSTPLVRIINGYPERVLVYSDWLGPDGGKGKELIHPGEVLTIQPPKSAIGTYGEATIFTDSDKKVTDFLGMTVHKGQSSTYFLSPFQHQRLEFRDYDLRRAPELVIHGSFLLQKGTLIISCSPDFYDDDLDLKCDYVDSGKAFHLMQVQRLCTTKSVHNGVTLETRPVLTILNWPARTYTCSLGQEYFDIEIEIGDLASFHLASHIDFETNPKVAKIVTFYNTVGQHYRQGYLVVTDLDVLYCKIPFNILIVQLVAHALSSALVLVSVYTIHCLHGSPRMRMTSYALPHIGAYAGLCIQQGVLTSKTSPLSNAIIFDVFWWVCWVMLTLIASYCRFAFHSWDIPWRPSMFWNLRAWLNIRLHHRYLVKEKAPVTNVGSIKGTTGILQHDTIKDKTVDDEKLERKVTFVEED